jgi:hypothetical protein
VIFVTAGLALAPRRGGLDPAAGKEKSRPAFL